MNRNILRFGILLSGLVLSVSPLLLTAQTGSEVRRMLDSAAERFAVPRSILYAVAYNESRWRTPLHDSTESCSGIPRSYGIMGLRSDPFFGNSLGEGAAIGITPGRAAADPEANILTGAFRLSRLFSGGPRNDIRSWMQAVALYPGLPESAAPLRTLYLDGVLELLRRGWRVDDEVIPPQEVPSVDRIGMEKALEKLGVAPLGGDHSGADWRPSPNYSSRNGQAVTAITIHDTEGSFAGSLAWLTSTASQASAHYIIRSIDGYTVQMVRELDKAWHVRSENPYTIGIEHEGWVSNPDYFTDAMYRASADLTRALLTRHGIALDRTSVKGHLDYPNNTHTDPGGWWNWPRYYRLIAQTPSMPVVLDPFEDNVVGWWQPETSGSTVGIEPDRTAFSVTSGAALSGKKGGRITYDFTGPDGGLVRVFRSGHGNTSDGLLNVGSSGFVAIQVRGDGSGNRLEFWFYDREKNNHIVTAGVLDNMDVQTVTAPLPTEGEGPYRLHSIALRQTPDGARQGAVDIDNLEHLMTPSASVAPSAAEKQKMGGRRLLLRSVDHLPADLFPGTGRIIVRDLLGRTAAAWEDLPDGPVGMLLVPGFYLLQSQGNAVQIMVTEL